MLPECWEWAKIGQVTEPIEKVDPSRRPDDEFIYLDISSIDNAISRIVEPKVYRGSDAPSRARQLVQAGDTLFSTVRTYLKNIAMVPEIYDGQIASTGFSVLRPSCAIEAKYLFYYSLAPSFLDPLEALQRGTSYPAVRDDDVRTQAIPLAPLAEQRRIVAAIEEQFTRLDAAVASLKRAQANLRRYRAAVLKAACAGRLVPQDPSDEPASVLLERILAERRAQWEEELRAKGKDPRKARYEEPKAPETDGLPALPEGWCWARLEQLSSLITSGSRGWANYYSDAGAIFIRAQDIKTDALRLEAAAHVSLSGSTEGIRTRVSIDDLLITITGANVTKTALVRQPLEEAYVSQHVGLVRPAMVNCAPYLYIWIVSPSHGRKDLEREAYGAGKPGLNLDNLRDLVVALPPLSEQLGTVADVERRLSVVEGLEAAVQANLKRADRLRQVILARAFAGRLVPQDPNDEPAGVLLERIRAARRGRTRHDAPKATRQMRLSAWRMH